MKKLTALLSFGKKSNKANHDKKTRPQLGAPQAAAIKLCLDYLNFRIPFPGLFPKDFQPTDESDRIAACISNGSLVNEYFDSQPSPEMVSAALKGVLLEFSPVVPYDLYAGFVQSDPTFAHILDSLSETNKEILLALLDHFCRLIAINQMEIEEIASSMGPVLLRSIENDQASIQSVGNLQKEALIRLLEYQSHRKVTQPTDNAMERSVKIVFPKTTSADDCQGFIGELIKGNEEIVDVGYKSKFAVVFCVSAAAAVNLFRKSTDTLPKDFKVKYLGSADLLSASAVSKEIPSLPQPSLDLSLPTAKKAPASEVGVDSEIGKPACAESPAVSTRLFDDSIEKASLPRDHPITGSGDKGDASPNQTKAPERPTLSPTSSWRTAKAASTLEKRRSEELIPTQTPLSTSDRQVSEQDENLTLDDVEAEEFFKLSVSPTSSKSFPRIESSEAVSPEKPVQEEVSNAFSNSGVVEMEESDVEEKKEDINSAKTEELAEEPHEISSRSAVSVKIGVRERNLPQKIEESSASNVAELLLAKRELQENLLQMQRLLADSENRNNMLMLEISSQENKWIREIQNLVRRTANLENDLMEAKNENQDLRIEVSRLQAKIEVSTDHRLSLEAKSKEQIDSADRKALKTVLSQKRLIDILDEQKRSLEETVATQQLTIEKLQKDHENSVEEYLQWKVKCEMLQESLNSIGSNVHVEIEKKDENIESEEEAPQSPTARIAVEQANRKVADEETENYIKSVASPATLRWQKTIDRVVAESKIETASSPVRSLTDLNWRSGSFGEYTGSSQNMSSRLRVDLEALKSHLDSLKARNRSSLCEATGSQFVAPQQSARDWTQVYLNQSHFSNQHFSSHVRSKQLRQWYEQG